MHVLLYLFLGFTYLGCIYDDSLRVLPYEQLELPNRMTTENCIDHCLSFNIYAYAGTQVSIMWKLYEMTKGIFYLLRFYVNTLNLYD